MYTWKYIHLQYLTDPSHESISLKVENQMHN